MYANLNFFVRDIDSQPTIDNLRRVNDLLQRTYNKQTNVGRRGMLNHSLAIDDCDLLDVSYHMAKDYKDLYELRQAMIWVLYNPDVNVWTKKYVKNVSKSEVAASGFFDRPDSIAYFVSKKGKSSFEQHDIDRIKFEINKVIDKLTK